MLCWKVKLFLAEQYYTVYPIYQFLFFKNKWHLYPQRVPLPLKTPWYVLRGQCCPSSRVWQPFADSNGRLAHFLNLNLLGRAWQPAADSKWPFGIFQIWKKARETAITIWKRSDTPYQITQQNCLHRAGGPQGSKGTLKPISRPILHLGFF